MPLSEHERKLLAEMEAALEQDDPRLVSTLSGKIRSRQGGRVVGGLIALFAGMAIVLAGLIAKVPVVGIVGFVIALVGAFLIISNFSRGKLKSAASSAGSMGSKNRKGWGDRLEDRWDRRNFEG
ncbi:MAG: DUF3040 domain-containing protein [Actinomycetes bacterium]